MIRGQELMSCRLTLWCLFFTGCIINYMLKICVNLAIVAMVIPRIIEPVYSQCNSHNSSSNITQYITPTTHTLPLNITSEGRFNWTEYEQGLALGAFYWSYWITNVPGGLLVRRYGTKIVFGSANFLACLIVSLIPSMIKYHLYAFLAIRVLQGAVMGVVLPSMHGMTAKWIPPYERSRFVSAYMGGTVGTAITYFFSAVIIYYFNWEMVFYTISVIGAIWYCFWLYFAYDSPQEHPRISKAELKYIMDNIPETTNNEKKKMIPWRQILTSVPFWVSIIANWGPSWAYLTILAQGPTYFSFIHGWDINTTGIVTGVPHLLSMIFAYSWGAFCDWLLKTNKMSRTAIRKLSLSLIPALQTIFFFGLSLSGCHSNLAAFCMIVGTTLIGGPGSGILANLVDLSPNYASLLLGICGLVTNFAGVLSPLIVGILTNENQTIGQWRFLFLITSACIGMSSIIYFIWGTADEQTWNNVKGYDNKESIGDEELQKLKEAQHQVIKCKTDHEKKEFQKQQNNKSTT
ncbi:sialin-like [Chelonus insularis]|uniref:sialin-like n=1 Tax=Chelonus insularis TaxID=460826 RepID=UPI00158BF748|nr:sialin-like [Chelonus insularis]